MHIRIAFIALTWLGIDAAVLAATPAEQYLSACASCHLPGVHGAPKVGDQAEWRQRLRTGRNAVYRNAVEGIPNTAMLPLGGAPLSAQEVRAIVDHMITATGLPAAVLAQADRYDRHGIRDRDFLRHDRDADGRLARAELAQDAVLLKAWARFDANRDGYLSEAEYVIAERTLAAERAANERDDRAIDAEVRTALKGLKGIDPQYAKAEVLNGIVTLKGIVSHATLALQAGDAIKRIAGIRRIDNRLVSGDQIGWD